MGPSCFASFSAATQVTVYVEHCTIIYQCTLALKASYPFQKPWRKFPFTSHSYFPSIVHWATGEKWRGRWREREQAAYIFFTFPLTWFSPLPVHNLLLQSSADHLFSTPTPLKNIFFFLISPLKAKPEHQGEPCVQLAFCGLSAVTRDHLETITQANKATRLDMCTGTKRVQTCYLNCHKFFLKVRFILTLLDKTKRPIYIAIQAKQQRTIRLYAGTKLLDNNWQHLMPILQKGGTVQTFVCLSRQTIRQVKSCFSFWLNKIPYG